MTVEFGVPLTIEGLPERRLEEVGRTSATLVDRAAFCFRTHTHGLPKDAACQRGGLGMSDSAGVAMLPWSKFPVPKREHRQAEGVLSTRNVMAKGGGVSLGMAAAGAPPCTGTVTGPASQGLDARTRAEPGAHVLDCLNLEFDGRDVVDTATTRIATRIIGLVPEGDAEEFARAYSGKNWRPVAPRRCAPTEISATSISLEGGAG